MLSDLPLLQTYRSDEHDLLQEFYMPCLSNSIHYRRAVGFFSSSVLSAAAKGLHAFIKGGGKMELVASPLLSFEDAQAIQNGYDRRQIEERVLERALLGEFDQVVATRLGLLAWLIAHGRLDIKIAVMSSVDRLGLYHEKIGLFSDGRDFVVFTGSPNETVAGLVDNFECIDVYCSWREEDRSRAENKRLHLDKLWNNMTPKLSVLPFPEAAKRALLRFKPSSIPTTDPELVPSVTSITSSEIPNFPRSISLRPYQREAVENWFRAKGRGTLKMATGSGKTITALAIIERLYREINLRAAIIVVPYRHLVAQWVRECERFGLHPIRCAESREGWYDTLQQALTTLRSPAHIGMVSLVVTNATFRSDLFQSLLKHFPDRTLLVGDEVHNLGAPSLLASLPKYIGLRLGLSATPERWFDDSGTKALLDYFGPVLKPEFTLKDALKVGALVPYYYYPVLVGLTDDEAAQYYELSKKIGKIAAQQDSKENMSDALKALLVKRARLVGSASNKLKALRDIMSQRRDITHTLFYCGDGTVEGVDEEPLKHLEAVCRLLGRELGIKVDSYVAETPLEEREELRDAFISGDLQGLVAIRCLDEGVDIPKIKTAFILASSANPRQFVQRRGRVLRPFPGKTSAEIYDFLVVPPGGSIENFEIERQLLASELRRYLEFARLAVNSGEVIGALTDLQRKYGLLALENASDLGVE